MAKLIAYEERRAWHICWVLEDDLGGALGQNRSDGTGPAPDDRDDWEHWAACKAIREMDRPPKRDSVGFCWDTQSGANAALRIARAALKFERPLPEWASTAIANGWKAPKGWKP